MEIVTALLNVLNNYGPVAAVIVTLVTINGLYIWRDWKREESQTKRIKELEDKFESTILPVVSEYKSVVLQATTCIQQNSQIIANLINKASEVIGK